MRDLRDHDCEMLTGPVPSTEPRAPPGRALVTPRSSTNCAYSVSTSASPTSPAGRWYASYAGICRPIRSWGASGTRRRYPCDPEMALLPPGSLLILMLLGWLFARRFIGRFLILLGILGFTPCRPRPVSTGWPPGSKQCAGTDAGAAQGEQSRRHPGLWQACADPTRNLAVPTRCRRSASKRIDYGLALHRQTKLPLVLSGGSVKGDTEPLADPGRSGCRNAPASPQQPSTTPAATRRTRATVPSCCAHATALRVAGHARVSYATRVAPGACRRDRRGTRPFGFLHVPPALAEPGEGDRLPQAGNLGRSYLIPHEMAGLTGYGLTHR